MKRKYILGGLLVGIIGLVAALMILQPNIWSAASTPTPEPATPAPAPEVFVEEISFTDIIPEDLRFQEGWCWNAIGVDTQGWVYMGIGGEAPGAQDVVVVRYNPETGERKFLTTLQTVSQVSDNLEPGEEMPKGHTRIVEMNGKIYLGSQGFHDIFKVDPRVRGGHLFEMDVVSETWHDLSATEPDGVSIPHQGIIGIDVVPEENLVVGLGHPSGDIVVYDLSTQRSTVYTNPDAAQYLGRNISRHIAYSSKHNRIYTSFAGSPMLRLDLDTGEYVTLPESNGTFYYGQGPGYDYGNEFVTAMAKDQDGSDIYYVVPTAYLYHFDTDSETLTRLGPINTPEELDQDIEGGGGFSLVMSQDEKTLYAIPSSMSDGSISLYRYHIATDRWSKIADLTGELGDATFAGGEIDDEGRIYFARFGRRGNDTFVNLVQITLGYSQP